MLLTLAVILGGLACYAAGLAAAPWDGSSGCSLLFASSWATALGAFVVALGVASVIAAVPAAAGNPLAGPFVLAMCLGVAAVAGGSIEDWIRTRPTDGSGSGYWVLALETLIWAGLMVLMILVIQVLRQRIAGRIPDVLKRRSEEERGRQAAWMFESLVLKSPQAGDAAPAASGVRLKPFGGVWQQIGLSLVISTVVGGFLILLLMQWMDPGQVIFVPLIAFTAGAVAAHQIVQTRIGIGILLSPLLVGLVGYVVVALTYGNDVTALQAAIYGLPGEGRAPAAVLRAALALPIHYASAGVMGAAMGLGWSQVMFETRIPSASADGEAAASG
ncbi:MAG: hypothetical protein CMJ49_01560 [Planctomycetaceae bacterium]|nr:hypothetical protein [Planctomycetaceae bacterium]